MSIPDFDEIKLKWGTIERTRSSNDRWNPDITAWNTSNTAIAKIKPMVVIRVTNNNEVCRDRRYRIPMSNDKNLDMSMYGFVEPRVLSKNPTEADGR